MSRTLEFRIMKLENSIGWTHPGEIKARRWFGFIHSCKLRNFTFMTELLRPSRDLAYMANNDHLDLRDETNYWRAGIRKRWREAFWSKQEENVGDPYYQGQDDPDFPGEKPIEKFMDYLLSDIDLSAFEWNALYNLKLSPSHNTARILLGLLHHNSDKILQGRKKWKKSQDNCASQLFSLVPGKASKYP